MLNDTIINQLTVLKGNIEWADKDELTKSIDKLKKEDQYIIQSYISTLNILLVDGIVNL